MRVALGSTLKVMPKFGSSRGRYSRASTDNIVKVRSSVTLAMVPWLTAIW